MDYSLDQLTDCQSQMLSYWELIRVEIENIRSDHSAFKTQDLPLARIKKIMKLDDDIKTMMISAEAPILFAKAAELFIRELTLRAWIHTERNRRRTLQRNDIAMAVSDGDTDQFDFLIDIVPREEVRGHRRSSSTDAMSSPTVTGQAGTLLTDVNGNSVPVVQVVSQGAAGLALPTILQDSNGQRTQILQLQMPEVSAGRPTLLLQPSDSMLGATAVLASNSTDGVNGQEQHIAYALHHPQQIIQADVTSEADQSAQLLLTFADHSACVEESENEPDPNMETVEAINDVEAGPEESHIVEEETVTSEPFADVVQTYPTEDSVHSNQITDNDQIRNSKRTSNAENVVEELQLSATENDADLGEVDSVVADGEPVDDNPPELATSVDTMTVEDQS
ncbi:hypothetical protein CRM22_003018 [Opisthorchis felineus]|uniref:Nuclear transcription factor Y subunit gamma n=1 Tax=Opisthorchis felineus TaxID=147828 RepID=A0A4S2M3A8_OPIFE|nr:hypothetical protein CRM22_003018 [Opisthorchis felineus]